MRDEAFITWKKSGCLRGCIGSFSKLDVNGLKKYALISAFEDPRFPRIQKSELEELECTVSLLHSFETVSLYNWEIGVHGVSISFFKDSKKSTFLPDVISEQGWTKEETIKALIQKAGFNGELSEIPDIRVTRYQSRTATANYEEFQNYSDAILCAE